MFFQMAQRTVEDLDTVLIQQAFDLYIWMIWRQRVMVNILAGGCFWGMEDLIRKVPGVQKTRVGYTGGHFKNPTYKDVCTETTGHAEALEIIFDPSVLTYSRLLLYFFQIHDPTTIDRQGNDIGDSYRSHIFTTSKKQREEALKTISDVEASKKWPDKIVTKVSHAEEFWEAEDYHQDYLVKNPNGYTCHFPRKDWVI
jgi:peptide-methionine (S)-S-oxide reductase